MSTKKPTINTHNPKIISKEPEKPEMEKEIGGFENRLEPTRYGDWDVNGRCSDF